MRWDEIDLAEPLMSEREFATLVRQKLQTVQKWRHEGRCPAHFKNGTKTILYSKKDVAAWLAARYVQPARRDQESEVRDVASAAA